MASIKIKLNECLKDSPGFRRQLNTTKGDFDSFESVLKKINDACNQFYQDGLKFNDSFQRLIESMQLLNRGLNEKEEEFVRRKLNAFCTLLEDSKHAQEKFLAESFRAINEKVNGFLDKSVAMNEIYCIFFCLLEKKTNS